MTSSWSDLCSAAQSKPLSSFLNELYGWGGLLVASFAASALVHASAYVRWRRRGAEDRQGGWSHFGWFTAMSCLGSVAGALAYGARIGHLYFVVNSRRIEFLSSLNAAQWQQMNELRAQELQYCALHFMIFPFELAFAVIAKLLVLHRMHNFALHNSPWRHKCALAWRFCLSAVVVCSLTGISGNFAAAAFFFESAGFNTKAAIAWAANDTNAGYSFEQAGRAMMSKAAKTAGVERFCEMATLLIIIVAFCIVGVQSVRVVSSALRALVTAEKKLSVMAPIMTNTNAARELVRVSAAQQQQLGRSLRLIAGASLKGQQLQQKVVLTAILVFVTCLVRAAFILFYGLALSNNNSGSTCATSPCDACKGQWSNINFWILYTPALQNVVILIASPLALLVALWGMTGVGEIEDVSKITKEEGSAPNTV